ERLRGETAAAAKSFEAQLIDRTTALSPMPLSCSQHSDGATDIEFAGGTKLLDLLFQIDAVPLLTDKQSKAITHHVLQLVGESQIWPRAEVIRLAKFGPAGPHGGCLVVDGGDPKAAGKKKILFGPGAELKMFPGCREGKVGPRPHPPHESRPAAA